MVIFHSYVNVYQRVYVKMSIDIVGRLFSGFADSQEINREVLQQHTACGHIPTMHLIDHDHVSQHFLSFGGVSHVSRSSDTSHPNIPKFMPQRLPGSA